MSLNATQKPSGPPLPQLLVPGPALGAECFQRNCCLTWRALQALSSLVAPRRSSQQPEGAAAGIDGVCCFQQGRVHSPRAHGRLYLDFKGWSHPKPEVLGCLEPWGPASGVKLHPGTAPVCPIGKTSALVGLDTIVSCQRQLF